MTGARRANSRRLGWSGRLRLDEAYADGRLGRAIVVEIGPHVSLSIGRAWVEGEDPLVKGPPFDVDHVAIEPLVPGDLRATVFDADGGRGPIPDDEVAAAAELLEVLAAASALVREMDLFELRPYQIDAVRQVRKARDRTRRALRNVVERGVEK